MNTTSTTAALLGAQERRRDVNEVSLIIAQKTSLQCEEVYRVHEFLASGEHCQTDCRNFEQAKLHMKTIVGTKLDRLVLIADVSTDEVQCWQLCPCRTPEAIQMVKQSMLSWLLDNARSEARR